MVGLRKLKPMEVLDKDDVTNIHLNSLELLEKMGVKVFSKEALTILEESGADVDHKKQMAWIPPHLVEEALRKAPKSFKLCARNPKNDVRLDGTHISCSTDGTGLSTIDLETGERRPSTKDDVAKSALIVDALKGADLYYPTVTPLDFPKHAHVLHEYDAALDNTQKHFVSGATYLPEEAIYLIKMAAAVAGGLKELRKRPIISAVACMMSPLILPLGETDAALEFSKRGIPVVAMTMPLTGATGPITLAGSVLMGNAQILGINTVIQMKYPGAPVIYSSYPLSMEVRTGAFAVSFPEATMVAVGHIQMARHYGLPNYGGGTIGSAKIPDAQAAYEKALCGLMCMLAGGDVCGTIGLLENYTVLSYEQLLIDYEMYDMMLRLVQGIDVNEDTLALDTIYKVGPEGHFLAERHTLDHAKDVWMPMLADPAPYGTWKDKGAKSVVDVAKEKAKEILATHRPTLLDRDVKKRLAGIIKEGEKGIPH
jgi:trimethylamine--corrinoid protein Co-methyltransferase